jgi:predicted permease
MAKFLPQIFDKVFVNKTVQFVFHVALPCHIALGIGVGVDFYSDAFVWEYICCFLVLRALSLLFVILSMYMYRDKSTEFMGEVAVRWLSMTWISTVILGVPILSSVFGSTQKGMFYGLLAGISSFIFQLPLQIFFFEYHALMDQRHSPTEKSKTEEIESQPNKATRHEMERSFAESPGFIISLSTFGKRFLQPSSENYIIWLQSLPDFMSWLGGCVSPLSLFSMGVWMYHQGRNLVVIGLRDLSLFMISKLALVPLLMVGLAKAFRLNDEAGRAAVLVAALPISMASFSLGSKYQIGEGQLSSNVAVGTLLMLPTLIIWSLVMDIIGLFPI